MARYVSQRAAADSEVAVRARVSAKRIRICAGVRDMVAFASTRRKRFAPEEVWDQPCGRQLTPARWYRRPARQPRSSAAETATAKPKEAILATARLHTAAVMTMGTRRVVRIEWPKVGLRQ
eukprot:516438-Pleurochrysis_carterae.AAC.2